MNWRKRLSKATESRKLPNPTKATLKENGMTLAEVLAALALTALLLSMLSQFLYSSISLWSKNDKAYRKQHQLKYVYQTIANDLGGVFSSRFLPEKQFQGEELRLNFWVEDSRGLECIGYRYDYESKALWRSSGFWGSAPEEQKLFTGVSEWRFEYFEPKKKNWVLYWEPSFPAELPSLIKITAKTDLGILGPFVFPIETRRNEEEE